MKFSKVDNGEPLPMNKMSAENEQYQLCSCMGGSYLV